MCCYLGQRHHYTIASEGGIVSGIELLIKPSPIACHTINVARDVKSDKIKKYLTTNDVLLKILIIPSGGNEDEV